MATLARVLVVVGLAGVLLPCGAAIVEAQTVRMLEAEGDAAKYWTRWRGPSGQGQVPAGTYPDRWSETSGIKWKVAVPGRGNSSPIVFGDRIFLTTSYDNGRRVSVLAFRRSDGARVWETFVPVKEDAEYAHPKNGYASGTPVTDGQRIYASFGRQGLVAVDLTGKLLWHAAVGALDSYHGSAGSPVLYKSSVIVFHDAGRASFIGAFDRATGKPLWRTPRSESVGWGTPVVIHVDGHDELIVSSEQRVYAYDPTNGKPLWTVRGNTYEVIPTPVVGHNLLYCASGRAGPTLAIRPGGQGDVTATHVAWSTPRGSPFVPSPALAGDVLYLLNDMQSIVTGLDARTGATLFQGRLGTARREGFSSSPVVVGHRVFFTNDDGETFVVEAGRQFNLLHVNQLGEAVYASPALVDGFWYFRTAGSLLAIGS